MSLADTLSQELSELAFSVPVAYVYEPLRYARNSYAQFVERYGRSPKEIILLGMNPGPWGMGQTGIPFGDVRMVIDFLGIQADVFPPGRVHPKRPVLGFDCHRREISGSRVWGWAAERFGTSSRFFDRCFVANYCPLLFYDSDGRNITPDRLQKDERIVLTDLCDTALKHTIELLETSHVIALGRFALQRASEVTRNLPVTVSMVTHPSPANPAANKGWSALMDRHFDEVGSNRIIGGSC